MYMHRTVAEQSKAMTHSINIPRCEQIELITVALDIGRLVFSSAYTNVLCPCNCTVHWCMFMDSMCTICPVALLSFLLL